jgi:hypothetical protein
MMMQGHINVKFHRSFTSSVRIFFAGEWEEQRLSVFD